jgi:hypothetical protein
MKRFATIFLRSAILIMALGVLLICTLLLPSLWNDVAAEFPHYSYAVYAVFIAMFIAAIPFFIGLNGAWRLLTCIDKNKAFTKKSAKTVRTIAFSALAITVIYMISMPFFYIWADGDDAPGLMVIGMVLIGAPMVIAVFAFLLHHLISEAADLKSESDLVV